uniref:Uncharacterized protein n=1 Tax=Aegilops tauschii subsp. strangulata TaxID=200361 RepID=A0A453HG16_AEGTS
HATFLLPQYFFLFSQVQGDPPARSRMFRNPRRAALLLAAGAAAAGAGRLLDRGDSATVVTVSASAPLRHLLSTAATGLFSSNPLFAPWQGSVCCRVICLSGLVYGYHLRLNRVSLIRDYR